MLHFIMHDKIKYAVKLFLFNTFEISLYNTYVIDEVRFYQYGI